MCRSEFEVMRGAASIPCTCRYSIIATAWSHLRAIFLELNGDKQEKISVSLIEMQ